MASDIVISARHMKKLFGTGNNIQTIYDDLNIDIYRGDFTVIMGASGAGKSTLAGTDDRDGHPRQKIGIARQPRRLCVRRTDLRLMRTGTVSRGRRTHRQIRRIPVQELNTADVNVIIPEAQHTASVRDSIAATDGVEDMEHRRASLASATVRDFAGADFDMTTVFYNIDDPRTLNTLADQGVTVLNTSNRVSAKQTRTMVCTLLVAIFLALAFIVLAVSVFLSNFRIRNTIANDMTQMGVLKALGYTSSMIIRSCVIPYALVGAMSAMVGAGLSYAALPALAHVLAVQSGFSFTPTFDPVATAIAVLAPTGAIVIFAYVAARSIRRVEPINAIRGIRPNTATVNHFPLETTNMPVKTTLLAKRIASSAGTNILLGAVAVVVTLLMSFAGVLLYNVVIKPANLMDTLSEETPSVIFTAAPYAN